jgi:two-component system, cell cycle sensor histidine kinase and response regulator CckA
MTPQNPASLPLIAEQMQLILESITDAFFILDKEWRVTYLNARVEQIVSRRKEDLLGRNIWQEFPERVGSISYDEYHRAMQQQVPVVFQDFYASFGGWLEGRAYPYTEGLSVFLTDITERKQAEKALIESERRFREMLAIVHVVAMLLDADGKITFCNDYLAKLTGYQKEELIGQDWFERYIHPDQYETVKNLFFEGIAKGAIIPHNENDIVSRDGARFSIFWNNTILRDPDGRVIGTASLGIDITERKRAENERLQLSRHIEMLMQSTGEGIYGVDLEGNCTFINQAALQMLGYQQEELLGQNMHQMIHHKRKDGSPYPVEECPIYRAFLTGDSLRGSNETLWTRDGLPIPVEYSSYPVQEYEQITGAVVTFIDITERKTLEDQFRQSQKMEAIGRLAGGIAHDFNNLLTAIIGYSEILLAQFKQASPSYEHIEEIHKAGSRAANLTSQLLAFSRKQLLQPKRLDLNVVIADMEKLLSRLIGEDIDLIAVPAIDLGQVMADRGQIEQVIMNLAVNARDAMPAGGKLTLETQNVTLSEDYVHTHPGVEPGRYVMLALNDTGIGMDARTLGLIFEPFFTTKEAGKGTGLGLSTVYGIIKQSGGHIAVYSEKGHGTSFRIYLPRIDAASAIAETSPETVQVASGSETILVVEDDRAVRMLSRRVLEQAGYRVREATNGPEALRLYGSIEEGIDLLLTDVVMPEMNGRELAQRLWERNPQLKVLFMTGYTTNAIIHHEMLEQGVAILQKPFTPGVLTTRVREVLDD